MSSHVVGGLSHYWDGQTAPNVAKVSEKSHRGISHDHGHYCVNSLADTLSTSLVTDDPFFGATALEGRLDFWDIPDRSIVKDEFPEVKEELDLGGRFTPESGVPWYERFDAANIPDSRDLPARWPQTTDFSPPSDTPFDDNELQAGSWSFPAFSDNFVGNDPLLGPQEPWGKIDFRLDDEPQRPPSELSEDDGRSDSSSPSLSTFSQSPPPEQCPQNRPIHKKNLMDIMKESLSVPEAPRTRSLRSKTSPMAAYFASESSRVEKPKVRGIVVKPYVDAATFRRRVMNRESARKYRAKKRKEKINVKRYLLDLEKKNVDLKVSVVGLEKEIAYMKKQLNKVSKA